MEFLGLILLVAPLGALIFYTRYRDRLEGRKPTLELRDLFASAAPPPPEARPAEAKAEADAKAEAEPEEAQREVRFKLG